MDTLQSQFIKFHDTIKLDAKDKQVLIEKREEVEEIINNGVSEFEKSFFNQIQIYQRDQSCVYDSEVDQISAAEVLHECLFGKWNKVEKEMLKIGQERLRELGEIDK